MGVMMSAIYVTPTYAQAPYMPTKTQTTAEMVQYFADQDGYSNAILSKVGSCESGLDQNAVGDHGEAIGTFQFHQQTFDYLSQKMGEELDINSQYDQIKLAAWALANGYGNEWTTYRAIQNGGSYTFYSQGENRYITVDCKM